MTTFMTNVIMTNKYYFPLFILFANKTIFTRSCITSMKQINEKRRINAGRLR